MVQVSPTPLVHSAPTGRVSTWALVEFESGDVLSFIFAGELDKEAVTRELDADPPEDDDPDSEFGEVAEVLELQVTMYPE